MKHIKLFEQFKELEEGLIKTVPVDEFVGIISKMIKQNKLDNIIRDADYMEDGHVSLMILLTDQVKKFIPELIKLLNVCGYFVSSVHGKDGKYHSPKNNEDFTKIVFDLLDNSNLKFVQIDMEPKFENETSHKFTSLYHITEAKHVEKILKIGLIPRAKSKMCYHPERIYLANKFAMAHIYEKYRTFIKQPVVLTVDVKGLKLYPDINAGDGAFFVTENIGPDRLKLLKSNPDIMVKKFNAEHSGSAENIDRLTNLLSNLLGKNIA